LRQLGVLSGGRPQIEEYDVSKSYRMIFGAAAVIAVLAVGGIAAAEQGGNSAEHRQDPTTSTAPAVDESSTTTTTSSSLPPQANPHAGDSQGQSDEKGQSEADTEDQAATPDGLCDVALWNASDQGVLHGEAFTRCDGYDARLEAVGTTEAHGQGGPPESPGSQSGDNGQGQGAGPDNPHAQGHGKP
jgi:hypothetical protein